MRLEPINWDSLRAKFVAKRRTLSTEAENGREHPVQELTELSNCHRGFSCKIPSLTASNEG